MPGVAEPHDQRPRGPFDRNRPVLPLARRGHATEAVAAGDHRDAAVFARVVGETQCGVADQVVRGRQRTLRRSGRVAVQEGRGVAGAGVPVPPLDERQETRKLGLAAHDVVDHGGEHRVFEPLLEHLVLEQHVVEQVTVRLDRVGFVPPHVAGAVQGVFDPGALAGNAQDGVPHPLDELRRRDTLRRNDRVAVMLEFGDVALQAKFANRRKVGVESVRHRVRHTVALGDGCRFSHVVSPFGFQDATRQPRVWRPRRTRSAGPSA